MQYTLLHLKYTYAYSSAIFGSIYFLLTRFFPFFYLQIHSLVFSVCGWFLKGSGTKYLSSFDWPNEVMPKGENGAIKNSTVKYANGTVRPQ